EGSFECLKAGGDEAIGDDDPGDAKKEIKNGNLQRGTARGYAGRGKREGREGRRRGGGGGLKRSGRGGTSGRKRWAGIWRHRAVSFIELGHDPFLSHRTVWNDYTLAKGITTITKYVDRHTLPFKLSGAF